MRFEWSAAKALQNLAKHAVSFNEATTVFADTLALTFDDPHHAANEVLYLTSDSINNNRKDDLLSEYDLAELKGRVRGKYRQRYTEDSNVVVIEPDLAKAFPNAKAVNDALRELLKRR